MSNSKISAIQAIFATRLDTLTQLLKKAEETFEGNATFLENRLATDMAPFGTQIAFTCNQPRNFILWSQGKPPDNLDPVVVSLERAHEHIAHTKALLASCVASDSNLAETVRVDLGPNIYADMSGEAYVQEFLIPNFYFHLVTAYAILRQNGVALGKADYMQHLVPLVRSR